MEMAIRKYFVSLYNYDKIYQYLLLKEKFVINLLFYQKMLIRIDRLLSLITTTAHRFVLLQNGNIVEGNYYQLLHARLCEVDIENWCTTGTTLNMILLDNVDCAASNRPKSDYAACTTYSHLINFKHKLYTGLPTRNCMVTRFNSPHTISNKTENWKQKLVLKANDTCCDA